MYIHIYALYMCACAYWENMLSLAAGWTWEHEAVGVSSPSGCQICPSSPSRDDLAKSCNNRILQNLKSVLIVFPYFQIHIK